MTNHSNAARRSGWVVAARAVVVVGLALAVSSCYTNRELAKTEPDRYPGDYRQRHPIVIREGERTVQIFIGARRGELLASQRSDVLSFAGSWHQDGIGGVIIEFPSGTPNEQAAAQVVPEIRSLLAGAGVPPGAIDARAYRPADPLKLATIRLVYPRMRAQVAGPCGLWPRDIGPSLDREHIENREYWNFGCANQRALAAMVQNPSDLVQPQPESPIYTARRTFALDKFRKGETAITVDPNANK